jgi:hypothetical protein
MLHLHVAFTDWAYIPQRDISAAWGRFSGARIVDVKEIRDPDGAAVYVARYIARELASTEVVKCVTYSRGWPKVDRPERNWRIQGEIIDYVPTGPLLGEIGGCLVYRVGVDCECLGEVRDLGLNGHLALMRIERLRGPP